MTRSTTDTPELSGAPVARRGRPSLARTRVGRTFGAISLVAVAFAGLHPALAQDTIEDARELQRQLEDEELRVQAEIDEANASYAEVSAAFDAAQALVTAQEDRISAGQIKLDSARLRLAELELKIDWTEYDLGQLDERLAEYAVEAYLGRQEDESASLLASSDVNDGVTRVAMLEVATNTSEDVIDEARAIEVELVGLRETADETVLEIEGIQLELEAELESLGEDRDRVQELREALDQVRREWVAKRTELEEEDDRLESFIANKQAAARGNIGTVAEKSAEGYVWPTGGALGSVFGRRLHPILGYWRMHSGLDIGGEWNQPIFAAKEGTVILAGVNGGYGNTIIIDQGDGLASLYAHQNSFAVDVGDNVETGEIIGKVGSTGLSTGPHLHFELRLFGSPIDPLPFLPARHD